MRELLCSTWAEALLRIGWVSLSREALKCIMHISHIAAKYIAWNWRRITKGPRSRSVASLPHLVLLAGPLKHLFGQRSNRLCRMQPHGPNDSLSIPARHFGDFDAQPLPGLTRMQHKACLKEFPKSWATCKILCRSSFMLTKTMKNLRKMVWAAKLRAQNPGASDCFRLWNLWQVCLQTEVARDWICAKQPQAMPSCNRL